MLSGGSAWRPPDERDLEPAGRGEDRAVRAAGSCAVLELILPIQQEEFGIPITAGDQPDLQAIGDFYQTGCGDFWVAKLKGRVVGTIALKDLGDGQAALRKMFVSASHRGAALGVASRLLEHLLTRARAHGLAAIHLGTTDEFVGAYRFYEKNGFRRLAREALPRAFPLVAVDTRFYRLDLDQDAREVRDREEAPRLAMLAGDADALAALIDDDLVFTGPTGQVLTKDDDLSAHRTGLLRIERLDLFDTALHGMGAMMLVTTKTNLVGRFGEAPIAGVFAYTRLWSRSGDGWRVRAGHCSQVGVL